MFNAKDFNPLHLGLAVSITGEPKAGKSHFGASAVKWALANGIKPLVLAAPPGELNSYAGLDTDYDVLTDADWVPSANKLVASAFNNLNAALTKLEQGQYGLVVFDTMSQGVSEALWHKALSEYGVSDPGKLGAKSRAPYTTYAQALTEFLDRLDLVRYRRGLHVVALWHQDIREFEGLGTPRKETEKQGGDFKTVTHWDYARLPMMRGSMRQEVHKWFDINAYVEPIVGAAKHRARLVVTPPDTTRTLAGVRLDVVKDLQALAEVPNDFGQIAAIVAKRYGAQPAPNTGGTK